MCLKFEERLERLGLKDEITTRLISELEPCRNKKLISQMPKELRYYSILDPERDFYIGAFYLRDFMIPYMGFSFITDNFCKALSVFLDGNKYLEIMAGHGTISHGLIPYTKANQRICTSYDCGNYNLPDQWYYNIKNIKAGHAVKKYNKVKYIIVSWMPYKFSSKNLINIIRKYNPDVTIISIDEGEGGCISDDYFFNNTYEIYEEAFDAVEYNYHSWAGIHDRPRLYKVTPDEVIDFD